MKGIEFLIVALHMVGSSYFLTHEDVTAGIWSLVWALCFMKLCERMEK